MKSIRLILLTALSFVTMQSFAQTPIDALRHTFEKGAVVIEAEFEMNVPEVAITGNTKLVVQGNMYYMQGSGLEIYNNGKALWTIDEAACEVVIESAADVNEDYLGNPVLLLVRMNDFFRVESQKTVNSGTEYILLAKSDCGVSKADLVLASDGKLKSARFTLDEGNVLSVKVASMKKTEEMPLDSFSPKRKFGSDWIVTDLR